VRWSNKSDLKAEGKKKKDKKNALVGLVECVVFFLALRTTACTGARFTAFGSQIQRISRRKVELWLQCD